MKFVITGGAGFVGSNLAKSLRRDYPKAKIVCFDNLKRRGSEFNLQEFKKLNIDFVHGDVRNKSDFEALIDKFDVMLEASAEPSVHAGSDGSPGYLLETNLVGTLNCLEFARKQAEKTIFLSTSRVYSIDPLKKLPLQEAATRLELKPSFSIAGLSVRGISEDFCLSLPRSLYGATKLASELICMEYAATYGTKILIDRCGVIAGPGQFGKVDQGVFTLWVANHYFKKSLQYMGFGGEGKQVRDLLHPQDLYSLLHKQFNSQVGFDGSVYNVGGGQLGSVSLLELTSLCSAATGNQIEITKRPETAAVDIPYYVTDHDKVSKIFDWNPRKTPKDIVVDIHEWIKENETFLKHIF